MNTDRPLFTVRAIPEGKAPVTLDLSEICTKFEYDDTEHKADKLTLTFDNWDLTVFDDPTFRKGTILEVTYGYAGRMAPARRAIIHEVKGGRSLEVVALGMAMVMHKVKRARVFTNMTLAEIATQIAGDYGSDFNILTGTSPGNIVSDGATAQRLPHVVQAGETDATFLSRHAHKYGLEFYVDAAGLHFKPRNLAQAPIKTFTWYTPGDSGNDGTFLDFGIDNNVAHRPGSVTKKGIDPLAKKVLSSTATNDSTKRPGLAPVIEMVDPKTGEEKLQARTSEDHTEHSSDGTPVGVKAQADGKFKKTQHETIHLNFTVIGDPDVIAKRVYGFKGLGKRISGNYYAVSVKHAIAGGKYVTTGKSKTDGHGGYGSNNVGSKAAQNKSGEPPRATIEKVNARTGEEHVEFLKSTTEKAQ